MSTDTSIGLLDTDILILRRWIDPSELPESMAISAVTLGELSAGAHLVRGEDADSSTERGRRIDVLQRTENEFDPLPFDASAARLYGRICAAVMHSGRQPRRRVADLMIAATASTNELPLYTTNPDDFAGLGGITEIIPVTRPTTG